MASESQSLSAEEIARLEECLIAPDADDKSTYCRYVSQRDMRALLAMASRLVELEPKFEQQCRLNAQLVEQNCALIRRNLALGDTPPPMAGPTSQAKGG